MPRPSPRSLCDSSMMLLSRLSWRSARGSALLNSVTSAACSRPTRGFTISFAPDLSDKAGTPSVTYQETQAESQARRSTLAPKEHGVESRLCFPGRLKNASHPWQETEIMKRRLILFAPLLLTLLAARGV